LIKMIFGFYKALSFFFSTYVFSHQLVWFWLVLFIGFIATIVVVFKFEIQMSFPINISSIYNSLYIKTLMSHKLMSVDHVIQHPMNHYIYKSK
jgi:hypothetical protein